MGTTHIGDLEQMVRLAISRLGSGAYGMSVLRELEPRAEWTSCSKTVYDVLSCAQTVDIVHPDR